MRFAGTGLLIIGGLVGAAAFVAEDGKGALVALVAGGFLFVSGAIFAAGAALQDTIRKRT